MKRTLSSLAVTFLTTAAFAQTPCGLPGVSIDVSPANPAPGQQITVTLLNNSNQTIQLPSSCTYTGVFNGSNCIGPSLKTFFCLSVIVPIPPGGSRSATWDQTDDSNQQVPPGGYSVEVRYWDANFTQLTNCCIPFTLGAGYQALCDGDGGNQMGCTPCPCGNDAPLGTSGGCLNPENRSAELQASGAPSVAADTMRFELTGASSLTFAVLASGAEIAPTNPMSPCFGNNLDGLRCAVQQVRRHGARSTDANGDVGTGVPGPGQNGWGFPDGPPGGLIAQGGFAAGQTRYFQGFYRTDPTLGCQTGQNTSQAIRVDFTP